LDSLTQGGIDVGSVTEIYGVAGTGKTLVCLQLCLNVQLPVSHGGLAGKAVFISTMKTCPTQRLAQLTEAMNEKYGDVDIKYMDNIYIQHANIKEDLFQIIFHHLPALLEKEKDIKLVVIDSMAGIFRTETNYIQRAQDFRYIVQKLENLADVYNFAILATNQVSSMANNSFKTEDKSSLGTMWETLVTTKLRLTLSGRKKPYRRNNHTEEELVKVRVMRVDFSPRLPSHSARFLIASSGLVDDSR